MGEENVVVQEQAPVEDQAPQGGGAQSAADELFGKDQEASTPESEVQTKEEQLIELGFGKHKPSEIKAWYEDHQNKSKWQKELTQKAQGIANTQKFAEWWDNPQIDFGEKLDFILQYAPKEQVGKAVEAIYKKYGATNQQAAQAGQQAQQQANPELNELRNEIGSVKKWVEEQRRDAAVQAYRSSMEAAKAKYKDQWNDRHAKIIEKIYIADGGDISKIADDYFKEMGEVLNQSKANYVEGKVKDKTNPVLQPKGGQIPSAPKTNLDEEGRKKVFADSLFGNE